LWEMEVGRIVQDEERSGAVGKASQKRLLHSQCNSVSKELLS
jgi:hypothetical protein